MPARYLGPRAVHQLLIQLLAQQLDVEVLSLNTQDLGCSREDIRQVLAQARVRLDLILPGAPDSTSFKDILNFVLAATERHDQDHEEASQLQLVRT